MKQTCDNCGGPEVRVSGSLVIWQAVNDVRLCAKCWLLYDRIAGRRIKHQQRQDLDTLFRETHGGR